MKPAGRASEPVGRTLKSAGRAPEPTGRASEPAGRRQGDGNKNKSQKRNKVRGSPCPLIGFLDVSYLVILVDRGAAAP